MTREEVFNTLNTIITDFLRLEQGELTETTHIINDAGADSLALVELGFKFSEAFNIPMITPNDNNMVLGNLVTEIEQLIAGE
ncbi:MAG: phosphopantetheine-binding protein [Spirochaetales bacterium]|nr:phosphopantetheine-binding protein [Spirochaetales bacterium]